MLMIQSREKHLDTWTPWAPVPDVNDSLRPWLREALNSFEPGAKITLQMNSGHKRQWRMVLA